MKRRLKIPNEEALGEVMEVSMSQKERGIIHYEIQKNCLIIYINQDLDHHAVTMLRERSDKLIDAGNIRHIIFDFKDLNITHPKILYHKIMRKF